MQMRFQTYLSVLALLLLPACSWFEAKVDPPLKGDRITILKNQDETVPETATAPQLDEPAEIKSWMQSNGSATQQGVHANFTPQFQKLWSTDIGTAYSHRRRITSRLVSTDGKVFAMDAVGKVTALDAATGKIIWQVRSRARKTDALAGGLALADDKLFVTNGLPEVQALSIQNGAQLWRTDMDAPARAAPTVASGRVYVTSRGDQAYGIDAASGKILWQNHGLQELAGVIGGASAAADDDVVLIPYMSGELIALSPGNGSVLWNDAVSGSGKGDNMASIHDLRAPPMIDGEAIIAANFSTNIMVIERRLGEPVWTKTNGGASQPMTMSGNAIFLITLGQQLTAYAKDTGNILWQQSLLPKLNADKDNQDDIDKAYWYGPLLLNNQLLIISQDGRAELRDASNGAVVKTIEDLPPPADNPIAVGNTLYWTTTDGDVVAYR